MLSKLRYFAAAYIFRVAVQCIFKSSCTGLTFEALYRVPYALLPLLSVLAGPDPDEVLQPRWRKNDVALPPTSLLSFGDW